MGKTDNHGAAKSGQKGETILRNALEAVGLSLLRKKADFKGTEFQHKGTVIFDSPYDKGTFLSDGFIPEIKYIAEIKYGEKHGSTEEKVLVDLEKIRDGVYGTEYPLVYIFWGTPEVSGTKTTGRCWADVFRDKVEKENLPVDVVYATTNNGFEKWINEVTNR